MRTGKEHENGVVAILDALGAASFTDDEIRRFINSRAVVLNLLTDKAVDVFGEISDKMITTFTFNDTILICLRTGESKPNLRRISDFFSVMRKFVVDSLAHGILFRGSIAIGTFHVDDDTNTVMGEAVTDAAAWYDKADWIGVHATPSASLFIQWLLEREESAKEHVMLDYDVPLKGGGTVRTKVVNWPKVFFVPGITPCEAGSKPKEKLLHFLSQQKVPLQTEGKFFNALKFFDHAEKGIKKKGHSVRRAKAS
jgi:hypothetical protein